jgi:hypothetical protein
MPSIQTFEEKFCAKHRCSSAEFSRRVFWRCLHRHAVPVAPVILALRPAYFAADLELIADVRRAVKMNQVWEAIREYFLNPRHQGWLRKRANVRVSARRLINLSREYLPSSGSPPPPEPRDEDEAY